jgi:isocitrate lyase
VLVPDVAVHPNADRRRGSRPTCSACRPCSMARTDALAATLLTSDVDERDRRVHHRRAHAPRASTASGTASTRRSRARSRTRRTPTCCGARPRRPTSTRRAVRRGDARRFPGKLLAYNCSPSFNWRKALDDDEIAGSRRSSAHGVPVPVRHARRVSTR